METVVGIVIFVLLVAAGMALWQWLDKAMSRGVEKVADRLLADRPDSKTQREPGPCVRFLAWLDKKIDRI